MEKKHFPNHRDSVAILVEGSSKPLLLKHARVVIDTVDGSEIRHPPVEVGGLSQYLQGFGIHPRWLFGISEPSTVVVG